jgi:serine phosphatase RsbU (regulator of sigma subunit)
MHSLFHPHKSEAAPKVEPVPTVFPAIGGADLAAVFIGKRIAGDFFDSVRVSPERVLFGLLDVAGRREENRELLATAQQIFREFGTELFSKSEVNESEAMTELGLRLNRALIEPGTGVHSCPAFIGCYHEVFGTLCYTNAGHTAGLLRDSKGIAELGSTGLPLGLFSHATADAPTVGMDKGAALLLVSRGVLECEMKVDRSTEEFGMDRLKQFFDSAPTSAAAALCTLVLNKVAESSCETGPRDDRTALALVRTA